MSGAKRSFRTLPITTSTERTRGAPWLVCRSAIALVGGFGDPARLDGPGQTGLRTWRRDCSVGARADVVWAVDRGANVAVQGSVERHFLGEEDGGQPIGGVDPEERRGGAVPEELSNGSAILLGLLRLLH